MATVSLIDSERQWFKSAQGLGDPENSRDVSSCARAILTPETTVVPDATQDERFADNSLVLDDPSIRFYAGHPVSAPGGEPLGTLCVIDDRLLEDTLRGSDLIARLGGDEFCAILVDLAPDRRNAEADGEFDLSLSLGYETSAPGDGRLLWDLAAAADAAMLEAKRRRKLEGGETARGSS